MRKLVLGLALSFSVVGVSLAVGLQENKTSEEVEACRYGRCPVIKKNGYRCKGCISYGYSTCWSHSR